MPPTAFIATAKGCDCGRAALATDDRDESSPARVRTFAREMTERGLVVAEVPVAEANAAMRRNCEQHPAWGR